MGLTTTQEGDKVAEFAVSKKPWQFKIPDPAHNIGSITPRAQDYGY